MANALSAINTPPPAPNPQPQQPGGPGNALGPSPAAPGQAQGAPPQMPPAPSHAQTVAALRHFSTIEKELTALLSDPDIGKADMKSKIIDGTTKLVADGILTPAAAVTQLGTVPEKPFDQKAWAEQHLTQIIQAQETVLAHRQVGVAQGDTDMTPGNPDDHQSTISGLMAQYKGTPANA